MIFRSLNGIMLGLATAGLVIGCTGSLAPVFERWGPVPDSYVVVSGDTLSTIAWRYGLDYRQIAQWNQLGSPHLIYPGQHLWLRPPPGRQQHVARSSGSRVVSTPESVLKSNSSLTSDAPATMSEPTLSPPTPLTTEPASRRSALASSSAAVVQRQIGDTVWRWPTQGSIVGNYRPDIPGGKGIQISGKFGQPVRAASPGQVVYSGSGLPGYGRLIILKHSDRLLSAYGYLGRILVKEGDNVEVGQSIAELGASNENRPILHFEIRQDGKPVDPLNFLPS